MKKFFTTTILLLALFIVPTTAMAEKGMSIEVDGNYLTHTYKIGSQQVFCYEPKVAHPVNGVSYEKCDNAASTAAEAVLSHVNDVDPLVIQYALWSAVDKSTNYLDKLELIKGTNAKNQAIRCLVKKPDTTVSTQFYSDSENRYQIMVGATAITTPTMATTKPAATTKATTKATTTKATTTTTKSTRKETVPTTIVVVKASSMTVPTTTTTATTTEATATTTSVEPEPTTVVVNAPTPAPEPTEPETTTIIIKTQKNGGPVPSGIPAVPAGKSPQTGDINTPSILLLLITAIPVLFFLMKKRKKNEEIEGEEKEKKGEKEKKRKK